MDSPTQGGIAGRVKERATAQLASQKDKATDGLGSVAQAVRDTTQHLRNQQHDQVAQYAEKAADQIDRLSQHLKNKNVTELLDDAQRLARRQPALFIGGAFAIGLLGARFLKSSAPNSSSDTRNIYRDESGFTPGAYAASPRPLTESAARPTSNAYGHTVSTERF